MAPFVAPHQPLPELGVVMNAPAPNLNASWSNSQQKAFLQNQVSAGQPSQAIVKAGWAQEFGTTSASGPSIQTNVAQRPECMIFTLLKMKLSILSLLMFRDSEPGLVYGLSYVWRYAV